MNPALLLAAFLAAGDASAARISVRHTAPPLADVETSVLVARLADRDSKLRRDAFHTVADEYRRRTFADDVLPPLRAGLSDPDPDIRRKSAFILAGLASKVYISSSNATGKAFGRTVLVDYDSDPPLRPALLAALASPDAEVRRYASASLGMAFDQAPDIEAALVALWPGETSTLVRRAIILALSRGGYSSDRVLALLRGALSDRDQIVQARAARCLNLLGKYP